MIRKYIKPMLRLGWIFENSSFNVAYISLIVPWEVILHFSSTAYLRSIQHWIFYIEAWSSTLPEAILNFKVAPGRVELQGWKNLIDRTTRGRFFNPDLIISPQCCEMSALPAPPSSPQPPESAPPPELSPRAGCTCGRWRLLRPGRGPGSKRWLCRYASAWLLCNSALLRNPDVENLFQNK